MEFFKKFKPNQEFQEASNKVEQKIEDQQDITIKGDISIEDYSKDLNRRAMSGSEKLDPPASFEEMKLQEQLADKFEQLMLAYNEIGQKLKEKNIHAEELQTRNKNATQNARRIGHELKNNPEALSVVMDLAIERANKLMGQLQKTTNEIVDYSEELKLIQQDIERIGGLLPRGEDEEKYDPSLN